MTLKRTLTSVLLWVLPWLGWASDTQMLGIGDQVNFAALEDQHGNRFSHQNSMKLLLFVRGMAAKDLVQDALAGIDKACLHDGRVIYVADISSMPRLVAKMMALPKMREYGYPVWLDRDGRATQALPVAEEAVSVIDIDREAISAIDFEKTVPALARRLSAECAASP